MDLRAFPSSSDIGPPNTCRRLGHHSTLDLRVVLEAEQFQNRRFGQRRGFRWTGTAPRFRVFWRQKRTPMSDWINAIFGQGQNLSAGQECARAVVIFIWGFLLIRFAGRRIFGQWPRSIPWSRLWRDRTFSLAITARRRSSVLWWRLLYWSRCTGPWRSLRRIPRSWIGSLKARLSSLGRMASCTMTR